MNSSDIASLVPDPDEFLKLDVEEQGNWLLKLWSSIQKDTGAKSQSKSDFFSRANDKAAPPKYRDKQKSVDETLSRVWNWLDQQELIAEDLSQAHLSQGRFVITGKGQDLIQRSALYEQLEGLGLDRVKSELNKDHPRIGFVGGGSNQITWAWDWVGMKENKPPLKRAVVGEGVLIAENRLDELRALSSAQFDFRKLIRLCEELNTTYGEGCFFATAMLTRGLLDHIPPLFGQSSFKAVANSYGGGGKSFKDTLQHLENIARKVGDAHLHMPIRESETLPVAQQVDCAQQLDVLLSEIVRITRKKGPTP